MCSRNDFSCSTFVLSTNNIFWEISPQPLNIGITIPWPGTVCIWIMGYLDSPRLQDRKFGIALDFSWFLLKIQKWRWPNPTHPDTSLFSRTFVSPQSWRSQWIKDILKSRLRFSVRTAIPTYLAHGWCLSLPKKRMCLLINNYAIDTRYLIENSIWYDNPFLNKLSKPGLRVWLIT